MQNDATDGGDGLPEQDGPTIKELAKQWIARYEACVRSRKYEPLSKLFHEKVVWCGLECNVCATLTQAIERECKEVWPGQVAFSIDLSKAVILPDAQSVLIVAPWMARGTIVGSKAREGRATFLLGIFDRGQILGLHVHFSLNPSANIVAAKPL